MAKLDIGETDMSEYYVDFGSWHIEGNNPDEVREKAIERIGAGEFPEICSIEKND